MRLPNIGTTEARVRESTRRNPQEFYGSKVKEYPQESIDEVCKIPTIMKVNLVEKADLATYQLKPVSHIWFIQWKEAR